jgi:hypothetical protein
VASLTDRASQLKRHWPKALRLAQPLSVCHRTAHTEDGFPLLVNEHAVPPPPPLPPPPPPLSPPEAPSATVYEVRLYHCRYSLPRHCAILALVSTVRVKRACVSTLSTEEKRSAGVRARAQGMLQSELAGVPERLQSCSTFHHDRQPPRLGVVQPSWRWRWQQTIERELCGGVGDAHWWGHRCARLHSL